MPGSMRSALRGMNRVIQADLFGVLAQQPGAER
jgi:hypothetical protein